MVEFKKPNVESAEYRELWRHLDRKQKRHLREYNRICVESRDGHLYVLPYSRFHDQTFGGDRRGDFYHVSVQEWHKRKGRWCYVRMRCGGIKRTHAALNVLGIKMLLESDPGAYTCMSHGLDYQFNGKMRTAMSLRESYRVVLDSIPLLGEHYNGY